MKRFNKHTISVLLMCSSIALLLVFQYFWLIKVYEEQRIWLQKEADNLFRITIMELQDSIIQSKIAVKDSSNTLAFSNIQDSLSSKTDFYAKNTSTVIFQNDSVRTRFTPMYPYQYKDTKALKQRAGVGGIFITTADSVTYRHTPSEQAKLRVASRFPISPDSIRSIHINKTLSQVILNVQQIDGKRNFIIKIEDDTLPLNMVQDRFANKLHHAAMPVQFDLFKFNMPDNPFKDEDLRLGPVPAGMPPRDFFAAQLINYNGYLFQKIVPQFFFSLFLIIITALAFWLIYRNLRQQKKLTALKNDFISNITHELKTPIATVSVAIEALSNFNALQNPQLTKEYLDISKNELNRLTILVDKVLKMSIFEQKEPELQLEPVNVKDLVQQITASMRLQFEKYHAEVNIQSEGENFIIEGDRLHLTSVIYNLVDNALKYSPEDPKININVEQQNGHLNLLVQDNGIGIAPEYRNRIFEKFFRVPTGDVHNVKGYGLGLNYVASVVQKHGGKIGVESAPGQGSCFTVSLPRKN